MIESLFGKFKQQKGNVKTCGFTQLALSLAAAVSTTTEDVIQEAFRTVSCDDISKWTEQTLGRSVHSTRCEARPIR